MNKIKIGNKLIGENEPTFIIAELSANHLHNYDIAVKVIEAAAAAGVDAFKIQTLTPDTMTIDCNNNYFTINSGTAWDGRTFYDLYSETPLPYDWHKSIFELCDKLGLICFSTPYDKTATDFLEQFSPPAYKIASFEITDIPLIEYVASKGKPIIISTGIAREDEILDAIDACRRMGNNDIIILKCTSAYPAPYEEINLRTIPDYEARLNVIAGLSDHTLGPEVPIASVALGAKVIEKHLTLDRKLGGPDSSFSLEPNEFKELVKSIRNTELALGKVNYDLTPKAEKNRIFSRSLFYVENLVAGTPIEENHIRSIRPGYGLAPKFFNTIIGKKLKKTIERGMPVSLTDFE